MSFRLVDRGWDVELRSGLAEDPSALRIVCPFIQLGTVEQLLEERFPPAIQVLTRFNLDDFCAGVSDPKALRFLLARGARIRGVRGLHAKLYIFGCSRAAVTSANLTDRGLSVNHELGAVVDGGAAVQACREYFERLWSKAGKDLTESLLAEWIERVDAQLASGAGTRTTPELGDEGADVGLGDAAAEAPQWFSGASQGFVKFFGDRGHRAPWSLAILEEVEGSGSHWGCTYPRGKRPRRVADGAVVFMGRLVGKPTDVVVYGRAVARAHVPGRDDATEADLTLRPWKRNWPHYIRVHDAEFLDGRLADGVRLSDLMRELGPVAFASTKRNMTAGTGNVDPRRAYMRQADVELTPEATAWLNDRLEKALAKHGRLSRAVMDQLDWPSDVAGD